MKEENFKKGLEDLNRSRVSMTNEEEASMLSRIFSTPIESPYVVKSGMFNFAIHRRLQFVVLASFIFLLSASSVVYASGDALPGDLLYPVKISVVEPVLDVVNKGRGKGVDWAEEKLVRRIEEAERLADKNKLTNKQVEAIEKRIKEDAGDFVWALHNSNKSSSSTIEEFRKKVNKGSDKNEDNSLESNKPESADKGSHNKSDQAEKIRKLKDTAIKAVNSNGNKGGNQKGNGKAKKN